MKRSAPYISFNKTVIYLLQAEHRQVKKYCFCSRLCRTSLVMRLALGPKIHLNNSIIMFATSMVALHVRWGLSHLYAVNYVPSNADSNRVENV